MRQIFKSFLGTAVSLLCLTSTVAAAQVAPIKNIVLVHGAWVDGIGAVQLRLRALQLLERHPFTSIRKGLAKLETKGHALTRFAYRRRAETDRGKFIRLSWI